MHSELHCTQLQKGRLKLKLQEAIEKDGIVVDSKMDANLQNIMSNHETEVATKHPEDSFQHIFWRQQQEAAKLKNASSMQWHPLTIKWCLYLRQKGIKNSEVIWVHPPSLSKNSTRLHTFHQYIHWILR